MHRLHGLLLLAAAAVALVVVPGASSEPGQVPLAKARLHGNYDVTTRVTSASGIDVKVGTKDTGVWGFRTRGATVRMTFAYRGASFDSHRLTVELKKAGAVYTGVGTATFLECFYKDVPGRITIQTRVTNARLVAGVWLRRRSRGRTSTRRRLRRPESTVVRRRAYARRSGACSRPSDAQGARGRARRPPSAHNRASEQARVAWSDGRCDRRAP